MHAVVSDDIAPGSDESMKVVPHVEDERPPVA
jgi:hypothetical protein